MQDSTEGKKTKKTTEPTTMNWWTQMFCATKREAEFMFDWSSWMIANGEKRHVTFPNKTSAICGSHLVPWCMQWVDSGKSLCIKTECKLLSDAAWHGSIFITTVMWTCELRWTKRLPVLAKNKASYFIYLTDAGLFDNSVCSIHCNQDCEQSVLTIWFLGMPQNITLLLPFYHYDSSPIRY